MPDRASPAALRLLALLGVLGALTAAGHGAGAAAASAAPRTSLPAIERQVMCVTCKIPLNVAQSPQADRERAFIQRLIDQGADEAQIKRALVGQYGSGGARRCRPRTASTSPPTSCRSPSCSALLAAARAAAAALAPPGARAGGAGDAASERSAPPTRRA